ncbi:Choline/Carnitine O-acyltransferase [Necator americanus]|uniref:Choline/Carnitine O-acyltransferase n=1 Tax=Necator americanus TaxID=51031 RepID=W2SHL2_NECAM|nr:Choline/Carnitine O-acyltransferase [Necator americanus]ETN68346.1 Choline/Carnitine O-acyltransferase [Necator americanus]
MNAKKNFLQVVNEFAQKELPTLQKLLEQRATKLNNWLTPWWLDVAYLQARTPLPVVTSPGLAFPQFPCSGKDSQIEHAAKITQAAIDFYLKVMRDQLPQDMAGKTPFDMSQYKFMFGTTRIPRKGCDEIRYGYTNENQPRHIVVIHNGHVFSMPVLNAAGQPLPLSALSALFSDVVKKSPEKQSHSVGIVSSDKRDRWAELYKQLEEVLFVILRRGFLEVLHGGGAKVNSCNRWFDKTIQFVAGKDGRCGLCYEHTPAEGPPVAALMDFICDKFDNKEFNDGSPHPEEQVKRLDFDLNDAQRAQIEKSGKKMDKVADNLDLVAHTFKRYGKNFPKSVKISPDSWIQMAFQLAFYRIHSACEHHHCWLLYVVHFTPNVISTVPPTYETATLRKFSEGRTENIRSPNVLVDIFVKKMASGREPIADVYDALKAAADSHKKYSMDCMSGAGMDRHLLAWNLLAAENGLPKPSILQTPAYEQMSHFQVSTSQVPTRHLIRLFFGPSAPDCYGICYNPQEEELHFAITSFKSYGSTSSKRFAKELDRALNDMNSVCKKALRAQSKL